MKFGTVPPEQLDHIVYTLPADAAVNARVLSGQAMAQPATWLGASSWGDKSWVGQIYPAPTPATRFRERYPQHFNAIELNATHYAVYEPAVMAQWAAGAQGRPFRFCAKVPQSISHYSGFRNVEAITDAFLASLDGLGAEHLGPVFLQLSDTYGPARKRELFEYLAALPRHYDLFLELRHPDWMRQATERDELFDTLRALGKGIVLTDTPGRRDLVHMALTVPRFFLRFVCPGLHHSSFTRTDAWVVRLKEWYARGLEEAYIFLHPGEEAALPEIYKYWHRQLMPDRPLATAPVQGGLFG